MHTNREESFRHTVYNLIRRENPAEQMVSFTKNGQVGSSFQVRFLYVNKPFIAGISSLSFAALENELSYSLCSGTIFVH